MTQVSVVNSKQQILGKLVSIYQIMYLTNNIFHQKHCTQTVIRKVCARRGRRICGGQSLSPVRVVTRDQANHEPGGHLVGHESAGGSQQRAPEGAG